MKVCKFGGTSVGTVERMKHVAELISESTPKIVVLSATAGTTNHLEEIAASLFNRDIEQAHEKNHPAGIPVHRLCQRTVDRRIHKAGSDRLYSRPLPATLAIYQ